MKRTMKTSKILRLAAKEMEIREAAYISYYSCLLVRDIAHKELPDTPFTRWAACHQVQQYVNVYNDDPDQFTNDLANIGPILEKTHLRIMLLCLAAAVLESEGE